MGRFLMSYVPWSDDGVDDGVDGWWLIDANIEHPKKISGEVRTYVTLVEWVDSKAKVYEMRPEILFSLSSSW